MNIHISQNFSLVKNASIFAGIGDKDINDLLTNAKISSRKKGEMLFFAEEKVLNFYIILAGTVKIFANNEDGVETILQIIGAGKFINDIFCKSFQFNAQAISDCTILSIKIDEIQRFTKKNLNFAYNILSETSEKNADLSDQIAKLKLTDSKQKVGQFLLGMAFEKSNSKAKNIELSYDKSILASYLGINPETLSRSLQKLKNDGEIEVKKNKITLLKKQSLCNYCDNKISAKCDQHNSNSCINHD